MKSNKHIFSLIGVILIIAFTIINASAETIFMPAGNIGLNSAYPIDHIRLSHTVEVVNDGMYAYTMVMSGTSFYNPTENDQHVYGSEYTNLLKAYDGNYYTLEGFVETNGEVTTYGNPVFPDEFDGGALFTWYRYTDIDIRIGSFSYFGEKPIGSMHIAYDMPVNYSFECTVNYFDISMNWETILDDNVIASADVETQSLIINYEGNNRHASIDFKTLYEDACTKVGTDTLFIESIDIRGRIGSQSTDLNTDAYLYVFNTGVNRTVQFLPGAELTITGMEFDDEFYSFGRALFAGVQAFFDTQIYKNITFGVIFMCILVVSLFKIAINHWAGG